MSRLGDSATREDTEFLVQTAAKILGASRVATSTAEKLSLKDVDLARLERLLKAKGAETHVGGFKFKLIDADPETPDNFGVLVRLVTPFAQVADASDKSLKGRAAG